MERNTIMRCERCGSILPNHSLFCENCGTRQHAQTEPHRSAEPSGIDRPKNRKHSKRVRRARRIRRAIFAGGAIIVAAAILILGISLFSKAKTMRAISSADDLVAATLASYVDSTGMVSAENSEVALSAVYQSALAAVSSGTFQSVEKNDNCVAIGLPGGGYYVYLASDGETDGTAFATENSLLDKAKQNPKGMQIRKSAFTPSLWRGTVASSDSKYKITTIQPYRAETQYTHPTQWDFPDLAAETIVSSLNSYSFWDNGSADDDNRDDAEVSIDFLKSLSQYAVVIWHGHGGYSSSIGSFLGTTEPFSKKYISDLRKGRIVRLNNGGMGVTSTFFNEYLRKNKNEDSLIYLGTCLSGKDSRLADAFLNKGFDCVVANSDTISRTYNLDMMKAFFDGMSADTGNYLTTSEAIENAKLICGDYDPYSTYHAVPILQGDTALRFSTGEQMQTSVTPVATDAPFAAPVEAWAQAYAEVLNMEKVGDNNGLLSPMVFMLMDMNGDGTPELIAAEMDGSKAEELVFTPNEIGAVISQYAVYTYRDKEAICIDTELISYANSIFMIHNSRNIVSGDAGTGYEGFNFLDYTNDQFRTFKLATEWDHVEEKAHYQFGEVTADMKGLDSPPLPEISETEYNVKYDEIFSYVTLPVFYDNTAEMRSQILGVSMPMEQPSGGQTSSETPNITEQLCQRMVQNYSGYLGKSYEEICSILGDPQICQFEGEGESYFIFIVEGKEVKYYFDKGIQWEEIFTYEELSQSGYSCSGSVASSFYSGDAKCKRIMITGGQTGLINSAVMLDEQITGPKEAVSPEGQDEFYYRYYFWYHDYHLSLDLMSDYSFGSHNWIGIQLNDDFYV